VTTRDFDGRTRRHVAALVLTGAAALGAVGVWWMRGGRGGLPARATGFASQAPSGETKNPAPDDDPTRAYVIRPGASVIALPPPTGTGQTASRPRALETRHTKPALLPPSSCVLNLSSTPPSTVILDGNSLGPSPKLAVSVGAGTHSLVFRSADGHAKMTTATCASGETKNVDIKLDDLPAAEGAPALDPVPCPLCERP
jgi:hypothetical protein